MRESDIRIDTHTTMYGVFGDPVKHSKSPIMLNRAFRETGVNACYAAFHVTPEQLKEATQGIRALGYGGVNVTIPHKVEIMQYMDVLDESAQAIGAVNTVVHRDGRLIGYNTDGIGYVRSLKEETGLSLAGMRVAVIGAGGAARGIVYALLKEWTEKVTIVNRTEASATALAEAMKMYGTVEGMGLADFENIKEEIGIVINTTSVGMHPKVEESPLSAPQLHKGMMVSDIIYNPMKTRLLKEAESIGCRIHGGLGMFIYQGAFAFEYWTGKSAPVEAMRDTVMNSF